MEDIMETTAASFELTSGHYYILRALATGPEASSATVQVVCRFHPSSREFTFDLPVSSGQAQDHARSGQWLERYYIFMTDLQDTSLDVCAVCPDEITIRAACHEWAILTLLTDKKPNPRLVSNLVKAKKMTVPFQGQQWPIFLGLEAIPLVARDLIKQAKMNSPVAWDEHWPYVSSIFKSGIRAAVWADEPFASVLEQIFSCTPLTALTAPLLETGFFDLAVVQERASRRYEGVIDPLSALNSAACPVCFDRDVGGSCSITMRTKDNVDVFNSHEADFLRIIPSSRTTSNLAHISVPFASDLFNDDNLLQTVTHLTEYGFHLTIFETTYGHNPKAVKRLFQNRQRVMSPQCHSFAQGITHFRSSAFVLLCCSSLRNVADIITTACAALMSGALPVIVGPPLESHPFIDSFFSFEHCASFMLGFNELGFQHAWMKRFRQLMRLHLASDAQRLLLPRFGLQVAPNSAEIICVSKRPEMIANIAANIKRQTFSNLTAHIIWNVRKENFDICKQQCQKYGLNNAMCSCIGEEYNIGSCLNFGILHSDADCWFKMDDDDYYGSHYIEDAMAYYALGGFDAVFRPAFFVSFEDGTLYGRQQTKDRFLAPGQNVFGCGATLSGRRGSVHTMFSTTARNSCDSEWQKSLWRETESIYIADPFNYCTHRNNSKGHTWHISDRQLKQNSVHFGRFDGGWLDAD